eukprot:Gb_10195 [translate_table: standard]
MAEMVLNLETQRKVHAELDSIVGRDKSFWDEDIAKLLYLQDVVKETLRMHPPSFLLSWAHLSTEDVQIGDKMCILGNMTAMVNMWSITHDSHIWESPEKFYLKRFVVAEGGENVDVRGNNLRLTPFDTGC